jgi:hypothetical protein
MYKKVNLHTLTTKIDTRIEMVYLGKLFMQFESCKD